MRMLNSLVICRNNGSGIRQELEWFSLCIIITMEHTVISTGSKLNDLTESVFE